MVRARNKRWFHDRCALAHLAKQRAYRVWSCRRTQADWEEYMVARRHAQRMYVKAKRAFNERSKALLTNAPNLRKWWSTVKTAIARHANKILY